MYTEATLASNLSGRHLRNTATNTCTQMLINVFKAQVSTVSLQLFTGTGLFTALSHNVLQLCIWWPKSVTQIFPEIRKPSMLM